MDTIKIDSKEEEKLIKALQDKDDTASERLKRFLAMPDLSRTPESPLYELVERIKKIPTLRDFDDIKIPEIVSTHILFDLFNMPSDHPARSKSDTYYVDEDHVLITHDTVMWYYYFEQPTIKEKIAKGEPLGALAGVMGSLQTTEVLKELLGVGESLAGHLVIYDALGSEFRKIRLPRDPDCPLCGDAPSIIDLSIHEAACAGTG